MINNALREKIKKCIQVVKEELAKRGFSELEIDEFLQQSNFSECLRVLEFIATDRTVTSWNTRYRFSLIVADCALRDQRRLLYGLRKANVRNAAQLTELGERYRVHFAHRCPKILAHKQKVRETDRLIQRLNE